MVSRACDYINENKSRFLRELQDFLKFPSISSNNEHKNDLMECALWLRNHLENIGLEATLIKTEGHPIVRARGKGQSSRRLIIYGHYDVQPADPNEQWHSPPFVPTIRDGFVYARGASDDKGQLFAHIKGIESLIRTAGQTPCDVMFLIEGEEESGGTSLKKYIENEKANLASDGIVISDTAMYNENTPAITYGLRGIVMLEVTVRTASRDLHSGIFGGAIGNPVFALSHILAKCTGTDGRVYIPGFYDEIRPLEKWEKENIRKLAYDDKDLIRKAGSRKTFGEAGFTILERIWARPTFDINCIVSGYVDKGMKTVIPCSAKAKLSIRLVPDQKPQRIAALVTKYIKSVCPDFANIEIRRPWFAAPVLFNVNSAIIKAGQQALQQGFGAEPVYIRSGGSVPIAYTFWQKLKKPVILIGFGLESDGAHSSNERFKIENFIKGAKTSAYLLENYQQMLDKP